MTRVKICGITSYEDALCAAGAGADYLGFIFFKKSPRYVTPEAAGEITSMLTGQISASARFGCRPRIRPLPRFIGVFVNETLAVVEETIRRANLDYAQLHGGEPPASLRRSTGAASKRCGPQATPKPLSKQNGTQIWVPKTARNYSSTPTIPKSTGVQEKGPTGTRLPIYAKLAPAWFWRAASPRKMSRRRWRLYGHGRLM